MLKQLFSVLMICSIHMALGQEMADKFRGEGKIYVVIAVILIILAGFFVMLFKLDNKAKRLEQEVEDKEK